MNGTENNYHTYQGKEHQKELDLNWHDFGFRNYDASLGRWMNIDPLADVEHSVSMNPYHFVANNPILNVDPDGLDWYTNSSGTVVYDENITSQDDLKNSNIDGTYLHADKLNKSVLDAIGADIMTSENGYDTFISYYENSDLGTSYFVDAANANYNSNAEGLMGVLTGNFESVADGILVSMMTHDWVDTQGWTENRNGLEHNVGMSLISEKHGEKAALSIGWGNEWRGLLINDRQSGNMTNALGGERANNGGGTAFEWSDISNNYKGLVQWRTYKGYYKVDTNNDGKVSRKENAKFRLKMGGRDE